jgi:general secretion pathway protein C
MLARLLAFFVWALVAAGAVYWSLKLLVRAPIAPAHSVAVTGAAAARGDLTRLLGSSPVATVAPVAAAPQASRFRLHGVMAPKGPPAAKLSGQGVALISVDGKPPRAYAVGARVDTGLVLQSVSLRGAAIGPQEGGSSVTLEVPPLPPATTGKLTSVAVPPAGPTPALPPVLQPPEAFVPRAQPPAMPASEAGSPAIRLPQGLAPRRDPASSR